MTPISGIIITLNEADNVTDCIASLQRVCDEVIVVDSGSQDDTVALAEAAGARVIHQPYLGDGPQKAFAVPQAAHDWILALDADERLDDDAVAAIQGLALDDPQQAFRFRRRNFAGRHWIRAAGFYPDPVTRLYNRTTSGYLPKKAHSSVQAPSVTDLDAHLRHFTYRDLSHWISRIDALSSRDAWAMKERGKRPSAVRPALHAATATFRKLILKGGLFQGADGFTVAMTTAFHAYMKYAKLNELYENERAEQNER
ncbi:MULTISPECIES: glycosyltransferase family 2 protein [Halomonas]|uniref:Glycosyl transferase n=2 Tax=Halomonas TaxID=2745 RepID=A0ABQ0U3Y0_9GAMM|nr:MULTISPECIES: glycosyltransferase family 2 protein [Halomonas]PSJ22655.1 glycosyltransferase family 2 protein [Halomonas sp. ND22Bw]KGE78667.1 glycosyl transferase [Halomonas salina]MDR5889114.1 glycosyltransferase family 2 protein [Halomonas salina]WJY07328.1 glycosyltransferase family 2 protein [Halomonas halophila]GEK73152.1 glycosyl transferase [Halomonas halophila]